MGIHGAGRGGVRKYLSALAAAFAVSCAGGLPAGGDELSSSGPDPASYTDYENNFYILPDSFGAADDRVRVTDGDAAPWAMIGRLDIGYELPCTGVMTGPDILATAGHCAIGGRRIPAPELGGEIIIPDRTITFQPGYVAGHSDLSAEVVLFFRPDNYHDNSVRHDYAFALLDQPIGTQAGWMDFLNISQAGIENMRALNAPVIQAGYSGDAPDELTAHIGCHIIYTEPDGFYHDCDTLPGDSGSPVFVQKDGVYYIVGINHSISSVPGTYDLSSFAVPVTVMKEHFERFRDYVEDRKGAAVPVRVPGARPAAISGP